MIPFIKLTPDARLKTQDPRHTCWIGFALGVILMTFVFAIITVLTR